MLKKDKLDTFSSEDAFVSFLKSIVPRFGAALGIGDDAAVVWVGEKQIVLTTDSLVENVHFKREWVTPLYLGKKAARVNLSDIAAMGAVPTHALVSLVLPKSWYRKSIISGLYDGLRWAFVPHRVEIIGGNVSTGENIIITLTLIGKVDGKPLLRSNARVEDILFCTGTLGAAACEVSLLLEKKKKSMDIIPPDRIAFANLLSRQDDSIAAIDVSDGLAADLGRLCSQSSVGAVVRKEAIPLSPGAQLPDHGLYGGEDYELLFTAKKDDMSTINNLGQRLKTKVVQIGEIVGKSSGVTITDRQGQSTPLEIRGWDHVKR